MNVVGRVASFSFKFLVFAFSFLTCASIKKVFEVHAAGATPVQEHTHLEVSSLSCRMFFSVHLGGGACEWRMPKQAGTVESAHSIPHHWTRRALSSAQAKTSSPSIRSTACFEFECEDQPPASQPPAPRRSQLFFGALLRSPLSLSVLAPATFLTTVSFRLLTPLYTSHNNTPNRQR